MVQKFIFLIKYDNFGESDVKQTKNVPARNAPQARQSWGKKKTSNNRIKSILFHTYFINILLTSYYYPRTMLGDVGQLMMISMVPMLSEN